MYSIVLSAKTDKICKLIRTYEQPFARYKPFKLWDVFEIKRIRKFLRHIPLGLNRNYSPHLVALKQQRGVTKRLLDAVVSTLVLKQNMIICQKVILDLVKRRSPDIYASFSTSFHFLRFKMTELLSLSFFLACMCGHVWVNKLKLLPR